MVQSDFFNGNLPFLFAYIEFSRCFQIANIKFSNIRISKKRIRITGSKTDC